MMNALCRAQRSVRPRTVVTSWSTFRSRTGHAPLRPFPLGSRPPTFLPTRFYQQLANNAPKDTAKPTPASPPKPVQALGEEGHVTQAEQRRKDWRIIKTLAKNLWPKNDWSTRGRIIFGVGLLIAGKVRHVCLFRWIHCANYILSYSMSKFLCYSSKLSTP